MYEPLASVNFQGGLNVSAPRLSQASQAALAEGTWNTIISGDGMVKPWSGATSQGAGTGSGKLFPFGSTWGGIKGYQHLDNSFLTSSIALDEVTTASPHGYVTGMRVDTSGTPAPIGLPAGTYWVIVTGPSTLKFATTQDLALLGTARAISSAGVGTIALDVANSTVVASGNFMQDIGLSRWGIGSGQPMIAGVPVPGFTLSTNLQVQIPSGGVYGVPVQAGLAQPSAPGIAVVNIAGVMSNSVSTKIARSRPSTGAISVASPTSAVVKPQSSRVRVGPVPAASVGQTHWRFYFTFAGFGGAGVHYLAQYNGSADVPESVVAAGAVGGTQATGSLVFGGVNPTAGDTITVNGSTAITFVAGVPGPNEVQIGASSSVTATSLTALLNAAVDPLLTVATYSVVTDTVTITYDTEGVAGNTFTLANSTGTASIVASGSFLAGGVDGIGRSLEFNFVDGDLIPIEASFDDYPPPAATHALRLNTVMNLPGCYGDSTLTPSNTGTAIAVSKENNYESYVPTSLLYLPEQVVDVLARPLDDWGYIACENSISAIQYVGPRGDELPSCTITTVLPDIGIGYSHNWCHFRGKLVLYTVKGVLIMMDETGTFDTSFANPVTKILKTFLPEDTGIGYDPNNDSLIVMNGHRMLAYSLQTGLWRQVWLPDYGLDGLCLPSAAAAARNMYFSLTEGGVETAYTYDTGEATVGCSFECNYQNSGGVAVGDIYEAALAIETDADTQFAWVINRNLTKTVFRYASVIPSPDPDDPNTILLDSFGNALLDSFGNALVVGVDPSQGILYDNEGTFTANMVGKKYILFGEGVDGPGTHLLEGTITAYFSPTHVQMSQGAQITADDLLLFVGNYASVRSVDDSQHLPNYFPNIVELRSYQVACWLQGQTAANVLTCDLMGSRYASSRTP